jgi:hypothetical protein
MFRLELTPAELKVTHTALHTLNFRRDDRELRRIVRQVLEKLPPADEIAAIDIGKG